MNKEIKAWLINDKSYTAGVKLYNKFGLSLSFKKILNRQPESKYNYELLCEQLRIVSGIDIKEFYKLLKAPVVKTQKTKQNLKSVQENSKKTLASLVDSLPLPFKHLAKKENEPTHAVRIREEFPFLQEENCPREFKILIADKITAYHKYISSHQKLFQATDEKEAYEAVKATVENFKLNREIYDELNHYKEKKEVLGKHPIFEQLKKFDELKNLKTDDLYKKKSNIERNISRKKKAIEESKKPDLVEGWKKQLSGLVDELNEIKRILNINEK